MPDQSRRDPASPPGHDELHAELARACRTVLASDPVRHAGRRALALERAAQLHFSLATEDGSRRQYRRRLLRALTCIDEAIALTNPEPAAKQLIRLMLTRTRLLELLGRKAAARAYFERLAEIARKYRVPLRPSTPPPRPRPRAP